MQFRLKEVTFYTKYMWESTYGETMSDRLKEGDRLIEVTVRALSL